MTDRWPDAVVRYPDPAIQVLDDRFREYVLFHAAVERLYTGCRWAEGPAYFGDGRFLVWSDIPNNRMLRWTEDDGRISTFRAPSSYTNGNTRDRQGRLVSCEHDSQRVTRTEHDGTVTVLMDRFEGKRLNAPNDVVVKSDGTVWFTDPGYGILKHYEGHRAELELPTHVYRLDPERGEVAVATAELQRPNGLCFSPDERRLYVVDSEASQRSIRVYDVVDGRRLTNGRLFVACAPGMPDGIRCDTDGNVWAGYGGGEGQDGVAVFAPDATMIGRIHLPERCANLCFGGARRTRLFMAASQSLYALYVEAQGAPGG